MVSDSANHQRPFARAGLLIACAIGVLVVAAGVVLGIPNATGDGPDPDAATGPLSAPTAAPAHEAPPAPDDRSVCGLQGESVHDKVSSAPETVWEYQDVTAYPTSAEFGPGATSAEGVRYCFQRSPEGALFAAANAAVQSSGPATAAWINYFLSDNTVNRLELLEDAQPDTDTDSDTGTGTRKQSDARVNIAGFRVLSYDGSSARIDLASRAVVSGRVAYVSAIFDLSWESGDWKLLPQDPSTPIRISGIPDLTGYVVWMT